MPSGKRTEVKYVAGKVEGCEPTVDRAGGYLGRIVGGRSQDAEERRLFQPSSRRRRGGQSGEGLYLPLRAMVLAAGIRDDTWGLRGDARRSGGFAR